MVVGDCDICWVSVDIEHLAGVHQLGREKLEWEMGLDDPSLFHVGYMHDGVKKDILNFWVARL